MPNPKTLESDLDAIRALAEVLEQTGLNELEIERGDLRLRISKGNSAQIVTTAAPATIAATPVAPAAAEAANLSAHPGVVASPMVGTAYLSPSETKPPFVAIGDTVSAGQTLMIIEAMKTMNEIKSTKAGKITQILAKNAEPVEFGEPLMIIE